MPQPKPRVEPLAESRWTEEERKLLEPLRRGGKIFNIFATLARHPKLLKNWLVFGNHVLGGSTLPPRDREIVILRVGWLCRAEYEWGHHAEIGKRMGLSEEEIRRCAAGPDAPGWGDFEAALIRAVDELHRDSRLGDGSWDALAKRYSTQQLMDFIFTVGQYHLVSMALNSLGVQLEEEFTHLNWTSPDK